MIQTSRCTVFGCGFHLGKWDSFKKGRKKTMSKRFYASVLTVICVFLMGSVAFAGSAPKPIFMFNDAVVDTEWIMLRFPENDATANPFKVDGLVTWRHNCTASLELRDESPEPAHSSKSVLIKAQPSAQLGADDYAGCGLHNQKTIALLPNTESVTIWIKVLSGKGEFMVQFDEAPQNRIAAAPSYMLEDFDSWECLAEKDGWKQIRIDCQNWKDLWNADKAKVNFPILRLYLMFYRFEDVQVLVGPVTYELK